MIWMAVTADEYELPMAAEDTAERLAKKMGTTKSNIVCREHRKNNGVRTGYRVIKVKGA